MRVYQAERNGPCPCGSGRKYKKCCQAEVEHQTRLISQAVGPGVTAHGREVIETLGFMIGLKQPKGQPPDATRLGQLLQEVWQREEEDLEPDQVQAYLEQTINQFTELLHNKPELRYLRIPAEVWLASTEFAEEQWEGLEEPLDEEDEEGEVKAEVRAEAETEAWAQTEAEAEIDGQYLENILDFIMDELEDDLPANIAEQMALSLYRDSYDNDELKTLLSVLGWCLDPRTKEIIFTALATVTASELQRGQSELESIIESPDDNMTRMQKVQELFSRYPVLEEMHSTNLAEEVELAYLEIQSGALDLNVPFYAISGGIFGLFTLITDSLETADFRRLILGIHPSGKELMRQILWKGEEASFFLIEVIKLLRQEQDKDPDSPMGRSLESLITALAGVVTAFQLHLTEVLYARCIGSFLERFPLHLPGVDTPVEDAIDLIEPGIIEQYATYLESQGQKEEADHLRRQYQTYGANVKEKLATLPKRWPDKLAKQKP